MLHSGLSYPCRLLLLSAAALIAAPRGAKAEPLAIPAPPYQQSQIAKDAVPGVCTTTTKLGAAAQWEVMVGEMMTEVRTMRNLADAQEVAELPRGTAGLVGRQTTRYLTINFTNGAMANGQPLATGDFPGDENNQRGFPFSDIGVPKDDGRNLVLRARAYLNIKQRGYYTIAVQADDGYRLKIGGKDVLRSTEPFVSVRDSRQLRFPDAGLYPIDLTYYQLDGGAVLTLLLSEGLDVEVRAEPKPLGPSFTPLQGEAIYASPLGATTCTECKETIDCMSDGVFCGEGLCQACTVDSHCGPGCEACAGDKPVCTGGGCVTCTAARAEVCTKVGQLCDTMTSACVDCETDEQCGGGNRCKGGKCVNVAALQDALLYRGGCSATPGAQTPPGAGLLLTLGLLSLTLSRRRARAASTGRWLQRAALLAALLLPGAASAQTQINAQTLRPALGPDSLLTVESSQTPGRLRPMGNVLFEYAAAPLRVTDRLTGATVADTIPYAFTAHVGVGFGVLRWLSFGVSLPIVAFQGFDSATPDVVTTKPSAFGIGDLRLLAKVRIRDNEKGGLGLAFIPQASFPLGSAAAFRGDDAYNIEGRFAVDYRFRFGLLLLANAGFNVRTSDQVALGVRVSHAARYGVGALFNLPKDFAVFGEAAGATSIFQEERGLLYSPLEGYVGARWTHQPTRVTISLGGGGSFFSDLSPPGSPLYRVFASVGFLPTPSWVPPKRKPRPVVVEPPVNPDGNPDGATPDGATPDGATPDGATPDGGNPDAVAPPPKPAPKPFKATGKCGGRKDRDNDCVFGDDDKCPEAAGPPENEGCPDQDEDGDGVVDRLDKCQDQAGPKENNGCPDTDKDKDGIVDRLDKCPDKAGVKELNGCPDVDSDKDGVVDRLDKCPEQPGPKSTGGCPEPDSDKDGIIDRLDKCPEQPGPKVNNGCPDVDTDGDGVVDRLDKCPDKAGPKESNGCQLVSRQGASIQLVQPLRFAPGKDQLLPTSLPVLTALAKELKDPVIKKATIEVAGGKDKKTAKKLAAQRAKALGGALLRAGVDKKALLVKPAKGPGEDQVTQVALLLDKKAAAKAQKGAPAAAEEDPPGKKGKKGKKAPKAKGGKKKGR